MARAIGSALVCIVMAGCSEAVAPLDFQGWFWLTHVNGVAVPNTVAASPTGCTWAFDFGSVVLGDGAFSMYLYGTHGCPGSTYITGIPGTIGGGLEVRGDRLVLRAIEPTTPAGEVITIEARIVNGNAVLTLPTGALGLAQPVELRFEPWDPVGP